MSLPLYLTALLSAATLPYLTSAYPTGAGTCDASQSSITMPGVSFYSGNLLNNGWSLMLAGPASAATTMPVVTATPTTASPGAHVAAIGSDLTSALTNSSLFGSLPSGLQASINTDANNLVNLTSGGASTFNAAAVPATAAALNAPSAPTAAVGAGINPLALTSSPTSPPLPGNLAGGTTAPASTASSAASGYGTPSALYYTPGANNIVEFVNTDSTMQFTYVTSAQVIACFFILRGIEIDVAPILHLFTFISVVTCCTLPTSMALVSAPLLHLLTVN